MIKWTTRKLRRSTSTTSASRSSEEHTVTATSLSRSWDASQSSTVARRRKTLPSLQSPTTISFASSVLRIIPDDTEVVGRLTVFLWRAVLGHLDIEEDLKSMTLVCHRLYTVSQSYLFRRLMFHPYSQSPAGSLVPWPYRQLFKKRMQFLMLPHIASAVTHCTLSPHKPSDAGWIQPMDNILDSIFDMLPNFPYLTSLVCNHVEITSQRMLCIRALRLHSITLDSCAVPKSRGLGLATMPLETVFLMTRPGSSIDPVFFSLFLNTPYLRRLYSNPGQGILSALLSKEKPFMHLVDLDISLTCVSSRHFLSALSRCPHLKRLSVHQDRGDNEPNPRKHKLESIPTTLIPELNFFRGPHAYIPKILEGRKVKVVEASFICRPESILKAAQRVDECHRAHVDSLTCATTEIPLTFVGDILILYPNIRLLNLKKSACSALQWRDRLAASVITPPPNVRVFHFIVEINQAYVAWENPFERVREALMAFSDLFPWLLAIFPSVHKLQMVYSDMVGAALVWRKDWMGPVLNAKSNVRVEIDVNHPSAVGRALTAEEATLLNKPQRLSMSDSKHKLRRRE